MRIGFQSIFLLSRRVQGPMLFNYICQLESYSEAQVLHYMSQLSDALKWLHLRNVAHLDIKPENILVCPSTKMDVTNYHSSTALSILQNPQLKLIDFGDAFTAINRNTILPPSNLEFSAPEVVIGHTALGTATGNSPFFLCVLSFNKTLINAHFSCADCWCFGVLLYVFLSGVSPFLDDSVEETTANILKCDFSFPDEYFHEISNDAKNLLKRLLVLQGSARATMAECQSCSWFIQVNYHTQNII